MMLYLQVDIYDSRSFIGGKVGSFVDKDGNHIEMGLHVFFGCYNNLFRLMSKVFTKHRFCFVTFFSRHELLKYLQTKYDIHFQVGADNNLLIKDHVHTFVNKGGDIGGELAPSNLEYKLLLKDGFRFLHGLFFNRA